MPYIDMIQGLPAPVYGTQISIFTSSADMTSSWVDTNFPTVYGEINQRVYDIGETTGVSSAMYLPVRLGWISSALIEGHLSRGGVDSSGACVIIDAVIGDLYNIGGISGEDTKHIVFTLWDNAGYGSRGQGK
jgi:hypothetical protein